MTTSRLTHLETCRKCERHRSLVGRMSHTGQCHECAVRAVEENIQGLHFKHGPALDRWRRGMAASVGATFLDNPSETR